jgi:hypothetical protein
MAGNYLQDQNPPVVDSVAAQTHGVRQVATVGRNRLPVLTGFVAMPLSLARNRSAARSTAQSEIFRRGASTSPILQIGPWAGSKRTGGKQHACVQTKRLAAYPAGRRAFIGSSRRNCWTEATRARKTVRHRSSCSPHWLLCVDRMPDFNSERSSTLQIHAPRALSLLRRSSRPMDPETATSINARHKTKCSRLVFFSWHGEVHSFYTRPRRLEVMNLVA